MVGGHCVNVPGGNLMETLNCLNNLTPDQLNALVTSKCMFRVRLTLGSFYSCAPGCLLLTLSNPYEQRRTSTFRWSFYGISATTIEKSMLLVGIMQESIADTVYTQQCTSWLKLLQKQAPTASSA